MLFPTGYDLAQMVTDSGLLVSEFGIVITGMAGLWFGWRILGYTRRLLSS